MHDETRLYTDEYTLGVILTGLPVILLPPGAQWVWLASIAMAYGLKRASQIAND